MDLAVLGILMIIVFMVLILTKLMSPLTALVVVPIIFGFIGGFGTDVLGFAAKGMLGVAGTFITLAFAILYFGMMLNVGLFDPLVKIIVRFVKGDPVRVLLGTAILATLVSLDGDGTTTIMICIAALLPVYNKLNIRRVYLAMLVVMANGVINLVPWGGPTARIMAVLNLQAGPLTQTLLPIMISGILFVCALAVYFGLRERKRLGIVQASFESEPMAVSEDEAELKRPKLIWVNLALTLLSMVALIAVKVPAPVVFAVACAIALVVNYRKLKFERKVIEQNAPGILNVVFMILGAGVLLGVFNESGMATAVSNSLVTIVPKSWGSYFTTVIALLSGPGTFMLNNDGFYFGVLPVLSQTAATYGFTPLQIGAAAVLGQPLRLFSPLIPALYLLMQLTNVDFSEYQKTVAPWAIVMMAFNILIGFLSGILGRV